MMDKPHIKYQETNIDDVDINSDSSDDDDNNENTAMMTNQQENIDDLGYGDDNDNDTTNEPITEDAQPNDTENGEISTAAEGAARNQSPNHQHMERASSPDRATVHQHMEQASPPAYDDPPTYDEAMMRHGNSSQHLENPPAEDLECDHDKRVTPTTLMTPGHSQDDINSDAIELERVTVGESKSISEPLPPGGRGCHDKRVKPTILTTPGHSQDNINSDAIELERVTVDPGADNTDVRTPAFSTDEPEMSVADTSFSISVPYDPPSLDLHQAPSVDLHQAPTYIEEENPADDVDNSLSSRLPTVKFSEVSRREWTIYGTSVVIAICAVLLIILLPLSFSYIEYYQFGMAKGRVSQVVEFAKEIYDMGRYAIGPGKTFKRYPATAHHVNYDRIGLFTTDRIILEASISFQYFIKHDELGLIEQKYDKFYTDTIKSVAEAAFKNKAATYSTEEYFSERGKVEHGIHDALRLKLGGDCCPDRDECIRLGTCHLCSQDQASCNKGYHIDLRYFQLKQLFIPSELTQKQLNVQLILEGNEKAVHVQKYQVYVKGTEAQTESIKNIANEITRNATAKANLIVKQSNTSANALTESSHSRGLNLLYNTLNIANDEHKASLHWLRTLERHQRLVSGTSFKDYIALIQGLTDDD